MYLIHPVDTELGKVLFALFRAFGQELFCFVVNLCLFVEERFFEGVAFCPEAGNCILPTQI